MKTLIAACLTLGLMGCETLPFTESTAGSAVTPANIYKVCLPIETQRFTERGEKDPKLVAHYVCSLYAGSCKDEPAGETCRKGILEYSGK